jgi:hypothetical protein
LISIRSIFYRLGEVDYFCQKKMNLKYQSHAVNEVMFEFNEAMQHLNEAKSRIKLIK